MSDTERFVDCWECGEPVDTHEPGIWKAANDEQWWHEDCYDPLDRVEEIVDELRTMENADRYPSDLQTAIRTAAGRLESAAKKARIKRDQDLVTDGGTDQPPEFVTDQFPDAAWEPKARENVETWGQQPPTELLLAIVEETGELADEITPSSRPDYEDAHKFDSWILLRKTVNRGEDVREFLESAYEDEDGYPIPRDERPELVGARSDMDPEDVQDELDDLGALLFQLQWALNGCEVGAETEQ